jgi:hypothetical protein
MFFPRSTSKVLMMPGAVVGETNGLYAAVTVNRNTQKLALPVIGGPRVRGVATMRNAMGNGMRTAPVNKRPRPGQR